MKIVRAVSEKNGSLIINKNNNNEGDLIGPAPTSVGGPKPGILNSGGGAVGKQQDLWPEY